MSRIRSSLFVILEDPSLREYLPFIEVLMTFIAEHPDFYRHG